MADPAVQTPTPDIPDKLYFRIGEVSGLVGVEAYVLRYWESEFPQLSPKKSGTGHRLYRKRDVEQLLRIKHLLYDRRFTIEGARQALHEEAKAPQKKRLVKPSPPAGQQGSLFDSEMMSLVRQELKEILRILTD
jgi:DNA-binding transcriptional MerR regulator